MTVDTKEPAIFTKVLIYTTVDEEAPEGHGIYIFQDSDGWYYLKKLVDQEGLRTPFTSIEEIEVAAEKKLKLVREITLEEFDKRESYVLTKEFKNSCREMEFTNSIMATILNVDLDQIEHLMEDNYFIRQHSFEGSQARFIVRLYRGLIHLCGDVPTMLHFLSADNDQLGGIPKDLILHDDGLGKVLNYVEMFQGR